MSSIILVIVQSILLSYTSPSLTKSAHLMRLIADLLSPVRYISTPSQPRGLFLPMLRTLLEVACSSPGPGKCRSAQS